MKYRFDDFLLDTDLAEFRRQSIEVPLEPQAYSLLCLLIETRDRVLCKDEIIDIIWKGRIITDSALSTLVKTLRHSIGDSGAQQRLVKTIRGRGFRFVGDVKLQLPAAPKLPAPDKADNLAEMPVQTGGKPSLMVLPFHLVGSRGNFAVAADAIPHELIQGLSRLRWLRVIARGTAFRFRGVAPDLRSIGQQLDVRYFLTGTIENYESKCVIAIELSKGADSSVLWSERYKVRIGGIHETRESIAANVISALEVHIPQSEARDAHLNVSENLDAWAEYHLGLSYMYRFNRNANALAARHFEEAICLDPRFARAHAGLSFTRFQDAFVKYAPDTEVAIADARRFAERSVELDSLDPFCNLNMGRSYWLEGDIEGAFPWLDRSVLLSPNFAQGLYSKSFSEVMAGRHADAFINASSALSLSPLDPLLYAMHSVRAFALIEAGNYPEATVWANKAARAPRAHFLIPMIAVIANTLSGNMAVALEWAQQTRRMRPDANIQQFLSAFPFVDPDMRQRASESLAICGF